MYTDKCNYCKFVAGTKHTLLIGRGKRRWWGWYDSNDGRVIYVLYRFLFLLMTEDYYSEWQLGITLFAPSHQMWVHSGRQCFREVISCKLGWLGWVGDAKPDGIFGSSVYCLHLALIASMSHLQFSFMILVLDSGRGQDGAHYFSLDILWRFKW